jgi:hypothetical protein
MADKLVEKIKKLNEIYQSMRDNYSALRKMFKNHSSIKQKFVLSEEVMMQSFMLINDELQKIEEFKKFNQIIKAGTK